MKWCARAECGYNKAAQHSKMSLRRICNKYLENMLSMWKSRNMTGEMVSNWRAFGKIPDTSYCLAHSETQEFVLGLHSSALFSSDTNNLTGSREVHGNAGNWKLLVYCGSSHSHSHLLRVSGVPTQNQSHCCWCLNTFQKTSVELGFDGL